MNFKETEGCGDYNFQSLSDKIYETPSIMLKEEYEKVKGVLKYIHVKDAKEKIQNVERKLKDIPLTPKQLAEEFHKTYENFAENNNWKTQKKCRVKFEDLPDKNKETMIDTCQHILLWIEAIMFNKRNQIFLSEIGKEILK